MTESVGVGRDHLAASDRPQGTPGVAADGVLREADAAVGHGDVHAPWMPAPGVDGRERRPGQLLPTAVEVEVQVPGGAAQDLAVRRPSGGEAGLMDVPVGPYRVAGVFPQGAG